MSIIEAFFCISSFLLQENEEESEDKYRINISVTSRVTEKVTEKVTENIESPKMTVNCKMALQMKL